MREWGIALEVCRPDYKSEGREDGLQQIVSISMMGILARRTNHGNVQMDCSIVQEPVHERPLGGHQVWVLLLRLRRLFFCGHLRTSILISRRTFGDLGPVRGRVESRRLLED